MCRVSLRNLEITQKFVAPSQIDFKASTNVLVLSVYGSLNGEWAFLSSVMPPVDRYPKFETNTQWSLEASALSKTGRATEVDPQKRLESCYGSFHLRTNCRGGCRVYHKTLMYPYN